MLWLFAPENRICHFLTTWPMSREWDILDLENIPVARGVVWLGQLGALAELRRSPPPRLCLLLVNQPEHHAELAVVLVVVTWPAFRNMRTGSGVSLLVFYSILQ